MTNETNPQTIASPKENCWRREPASRAAFLVDADAYFKAFVQAVECARHSILIIGWDIDSRLTLYRDNTTAGGTETLGELLNSLAKKRKSLHINILIWDYALFYAMERDPLLTYKLKHRSHPRIKFYYDAKHPTGASHHQKIVVIDDKLAFCGGMDITTHRWDTPQHLAKNKKRVNAFGISYGPYHDVQMAVDGQAAGALGDLARQRWQRATGEILDAVPDIDNDPWPAELQADVEDVKVAVSRTDVCLPGQEIREVEKLHLKAIASAQRYIYIENQFLTSACIGNALAQSLKEKNGPEIIIITPKKGPGWLETKTLGSMRERIIYNCRQSDTYNRFRVYYPIVPGPDNPDVFIHSKIFISDDYFLRIGSANLSNRSMGLDTECDLVIESEGDLTRAQKIQAFRNRLLAEHLGVTPAQVFHAEEKKKSLIKAVESLREGNRTLKSLEEELPEWIAELVPESTFFDPEEPLFPHISPEEVIPPPSKRKKILLKGLLIVTIALALAAAWRYTGLSAYAKPSAVASLAKALKDSPWSPLITIGLFAFSGLTMFPITVLLLMVAILFPPVTAFLYSLAGCLLNASLMYIIGARLNKDRIKKLAGNQFDSLRKKFRKRGILTVAVLRNVPIAPFALFNLVAGFSHVNFKDYILGTLLGMAPGILAVAFLGKSLVEAIEIPNSLNVLIVILLLILLIITFVVIKNKAQKLNS